MSLRRAALAALVCVLVAFAHTAAAQESVIVVRHAERQDNSTDSPLSATGEQRAARLATVLKDTRLSAIITSTLRRTQQTAKPVAAAQRLTPVAIPGDDFDKLVTAIRASGPVGHVLVVGHSNTIPDILHRLGVREPVSVPDTDFSTIFVVVPQPDSVPQLIRLHY